jgi:START domain
MVWGLGQLQLGSSPARADQAASWQFVREQDGIASYRRERPGAPLSGFRARATFPADMWTVLSILEDVDRACEWTAHCDEMRKLQVRSDVEMLVYARMNAPWPVRDRDVVTRIAMSINSVTQVVADISSVAGGPAAPDDVVRIPAMQARYTFVAKGPRQVDVEYEIEVDPGGTLPDWVKNMVGRDLAHQTLQRLRERASWALERGVYVRRASQLQQIARGVIREREARSAEIALTNSAR